MHTYGDRRKTVIAFAVFAGITAAVYYPVISNIKTVVNGSLDDAYAILWYVWWFKHSIVDLHISPSFSPLVESPYGVAITHSTILNHLIALPFTSLWGPVASYNIMILLSFVLSAAGMYLLVYEVTRSAAPSAFSALAYAFSPYHTAFSASGGMDGAQIQYMPLTLLFLIRHEKTGSFKDLVLFLIFTALTLLSFGYYAALILLAIIVFVLYIKVLPIAFEYLRPGSETPPLAKVLFWASAAYIFMELAGNTIEGLAGPLRIAAYIAVPTAIAASVRGPGKGFSPLFNSVRERYVRMDARVRAVFLVGTIAVAVPTLVFLVPVFGAASRNISDSYLVPLYSYFVPPIDHPLLGALVPSRFVPGPDPFAGKMVYLGLVVTSLTFCSLVFRIRRAGERNRVIEYFIVLLAVGVMLIPPPRIRIGDLSFYTPIYYFHALVPPFVDVRRVIVLVLLSACVLAGAALKEIGTRMDGRAKRFALFTLLFALLATEFYPGISAADLKRVPSAYGWLAQRQGDFTVIEYPLTSLYDTRRYEAFFGQTIHGKRLVNPFGASGHDPTPSNDRLNALITGGGPANEIFANTGNALSALSYIGVRYIVVRTDKMPEPLGIEAGDGLLTEAARFPDSIVYEVASRPRRAYASFSGFYRDGYFKNYLEGRGRNYHVRNPYVKPGLSWMDGVAWMWTGKDAVVNITAFNREELYCDLHFTARAAKDAVGFVVRDADGNKYGFIAGRAPQEYVIKGIHVKPLDTRVLNFEATDGSVVAEGAGDFQEADPQGKGTYIGIGIRDVHITEAGPPAREAEALKAYDGIFVEHE
ncbi:MAG: glycosyltransferase family 39 protein [Deltaproteobacteria bacterium]|nr:glycosyltransferase family 39 protein [Deltaproteobacteria bacterium]